MARGADRDAGAAGTTDSGGDRAEKRRSARFVVRAADGSARTLQPTPRRRLPREAVYLSPRFHPEDVRKPSFIASDGRREWQDDDEMLHRGNDRPAVIDPDGSLEWLVHGEYHRDGDEPAVILADGTRWWFKNGLRHRDGDRPAIINSDGTREWWTRGVPVRKDESD